MKKTRKKKKELLDRLGIRKSFLEQEREAFQKEKANLDLMIEKDKKLSAI